MSSVWKLIKYIPSPAMVMVKACTTTSFRLWVRDHFGGGQASIPDTIRSVADGRRFHIGPDYIYWNIYIGKEFEPDATELLRRLVKPGQVAVDIGANFGWYTTLLSSLVGPNGRVIAFEPLPSTYDRLSEHVEMNGATDNTRLFNLAVGREAGTVTIFTFDELSHSRSSLVQLDERKGTATDVQLVKLDDLLQEQEISRVDFLKCDVEGSELAAFQGAGTLLSSDSAPVIMVELNDETSEAFGYTKLDLVNHLKEVGYDRFFIVKSPAMLDEVRHDRELDSGALLFCAKGRNLADDAKA